MDGSTVYFDIETTGLDSKDGSIISIAASCNGQLFSSLVKPANPIPTESTRIHGLTDVDVADAPTWSVVGPTFLRWVYDTAGKTPTLVAFNGFSFDIPWVVEKNKSVDAAEFPVFDAVYAADPLVAARANFSRQEVGGSFRQAALYEWLFGSSPTAQHTADGDVKALVRIAEHEKFSKIVAASRRRLLDVTGAKDK